MQKEKLRTAKTTAFAALIIAFSLTSCGEEATTKTPVIASASTATAMPEVTVSAKQYDADYKANEITADDKYKDKVIKMTGRVLSIEKDIMDEPYITLGTGGDMDEIGMGVECKFSHKSDVRKISKGQIITLVGKGDGMAATIPMLSACTLSTN